MTGPDLARVEAIRRFNRFYTRRIGVLHEGLSASRFTLTESRLLWELAHRDALTASELARDLELDAGYLSRLLRSFKERGLIQGDVDIEQLIDTSFAERAVKELAASSKTN